LDRWLLCAIGHNHESDYGADRDELRL
jgi:hypothetical protein